MLRYCTRCGTPSNDEDCFCGGKTRPVAVPMNREPLVRRMVDRGWFEYGPAVRRMV